MLAKLHFQLLNNSSGICRIELTHLKERRVVLHSDQVVALVK